MKKLVFLLLFLSVLSCKKESKETGIEIKQEHKTQKINIWESMSFEEQVKSIKDNTTKDSITSNDISYINDSILKGKFKLDISKYQHEDKKNKCYPIRFSKKIISEFYSDGFKNLGDLNGDKKEDSVFVLQNLNSCEEGDSYYFTDNDIPRIQTESYCCHPESIFSIGDIDEDGGNEIAEYYSSCTSNFKSFRIWTLKDNKWKFIEQFGFFYNNGKYEVFKDFDKLYKKISKNKFKFLEISDMRGNGEMVKEWRTVTME
ncbi:hypothetical protein [Flavobacterium sp. ov086]|uniref:hypothetical protein n=1 Tax=Flavobacterium sp. ov086 TaxID=1761785 RepID=UPI000B70A0FC|nr:hypothetical protein [Flavobacterium sp. ov086]SNR92775.1 hypothetical protein SAMN04487979_13142 [Flavobacterium sp. ov086]